MTNGYSNATIDLGKPDNMTYILANNTKYWVASRSLRVLSSDAGFFVAYVWNGGVRNGYDLFYSYVNGSYVDRDGDRDSMAIRPCVVLSSETPWSDVESLIGNFK